MMLHNAHIDAHNMAEVARTALAGSMSLAALGLVSMVGSATLASGGFLAPVACAVVMQGSLGASVAGILGAGFSKLWLKTEQRHSDLLSVVTGKLDQGNDLQSTIDFHLGDELAAKLGGWRQTRPQLNSSTGVGPGIRSTS